MGSGNSCYLLRQRQGWYAVVEVPFSLRKRFGRRIKRTLDTRDKHVANSRKWLVVAEIKSLIEAARNWQTEGAPQLEALGWRETLAAAERGEDVVNLPADEDPASFIRGLIVDRAEQLEARPSTEAQAPPFRDIALGLATPLAIYVDQWLSEGALRGIALKERTKAERKRAVDKLEVWLGHERLPATIEAVTRRVAGRRYVSQGLLPSWRDPVTLVKSVRSLTSYWAWFIRTTHPDD